MLLSLRCLCSVRQQLGRDHYDTARMVTAFVLVRLDYCNAVVLPVGRILAGLPTSTLVPLQQVLYVASRRPTALNLKPRDHTFYALRELDWLPASSH